MKNDSFSVDVIRRVLAVLSNEGNMKRTNLANKTGLNFNGLRRYLEFLKTLRWVDFTSDAGSQVSITTVGRSFKKLLDHEEGPEDISEQVLERLMAEPQDSPTGEKANDDDNPSCPICGNSIQKRVISRQIAGNTYFFDKSECATLFMKFKDVYGKEFAI